MADVQNGASGQMIIAAINGKLDKNGGTVTGDTTFETQINTNTICTQDGSPMISNTSNGVVGKNGITIGEMVCGKYVGNNSPTQRIHIGFRPTWVFVYPQTLYDIDNATPNSQILTRRALTKFALAVDGVNSETGSDYGYSVYITDDGFQVSGNHGSSYEYEARTNENGAVYSFIAGKCAFIDTTTGGGA